MSAQTPQRIDKIPDREDLETEIRMLKALCEELKGALANIEMETRRGGQWDAAEINEIAKAALKKAKKDI
jgi:Fic family protein